MASICEKAISTLTGNLNSDRSYLITAVCVLIFGQSLEIPVIVNGDAIADCLCLKRRAAHAAASRRRRQAVTDGRFETREQHQLKKLLQRSETCAAARVRFCRVLCVFLQLQCYEATKKSQLHSTVNS